MLYRLILADWAYVKGKRRVIENYLDDAELERLNNEGYNCYTILNYSSTFEPGRRDEDNRPIYLEGHDIDRFDYCFVDMDLKDGTYPSKEAFVEHINRSELKPTSIIDSGNGIHVYWKVNDLDALSYVRLQKRLARFCKTDPTVFTIYRLMRVPGTYNVKSKDNKKLCHVLESNEIEYTCEQLSKLLPAITAKEEEESQDHFNQTYNPKEMENISDEIPLKFITLCKKSPEAKQLFYGPVEDRSKADFRLAHLMFGDGFSKEDMLAVLLNTSKAMSRKNQHRYNYAMNIVEKIYQVEAQAAKLGTSPQESGEETVTPVHRISKSIMDILAPGAGDISSPRIYGHPMFDATDYGFRLGQVIGIIGGSGVGKTTTSMNYFLWFVERNPNYIHVFVSLEQPEKEIAQRWQKTCGGRTELYNKVHVIGNMDEDGQFKRRSFCELEKEIKRIEEETGRKVGCVVIDHIAVLKHVNKDGKRVEIEEMCSEMKSFALSTNTLVCMLSQTSRAKAGIGDIELDKDAAFGTVFFESYCDYVITTWQPLKRVYDKAPHMTVNAFKFCKIRHKNVLKDNLKEDVVYAMMFDPTSETLREPTSDEFEQYEFWNKQANALRNKDRKREPVPLNRMHWLPKKEEA